MARRKPVSLWLNRDYMLLWSGQVVSATGSRISLLAFPLLVLAITHSPAQAGLLSAFGSIPYILFILPAGALVDRWNRKLVMIFCDSGRALALGSIPIAFILGRLTIGQLYVVSLVEGTLFIFFSLAETACMPEVVPQEQLTEAAAQGTIINSIASMIGPALGGIIYGLGRAVPFATDAISYMFSVVSLLFVRTPLRQQRAATPVNLLQEMKEGIVWLWNHPVIRFIALLTWGIYTPVIGYGLILIVLAQGQHASSFVIGLIFAAGGLGSILGALLVPILKKRFRFGQLMIGGTWAWSLTWLFFAIAPNPLVLGIVTTLSFIVVPIYSSVHVGYRLERIPQHLQGRVNSVFRLIAFGSEPLGMAVTGFLLQLCGPIPTVLILFVPQGILSIVVTFSKHFKDREDSPGNIPGRQQASPLP